MAAYFTFGLNLTFWKKMIAAIHAESEVPFAFIISLPIAMTAIFFLIFILFSLLRVQKPLFAILLPLGAIANYATFTYGITIDNNMIANVIETTQAEASTYLTFEFILWFVLSGIIPLILVVMTNITRPDFKRDLRNHILSMVCAAGLLGLIGVAFSIEYMTVMRNNKGIEKSVVPTYSISSTVKYFKRKYLIDRIPFQEIGQDAAITRMPANGKKDVFIFVLGETARSQNYSLNGYEKPTNAHTQNMDVISFREARSCGTATAVSVPCLFSFMGREDYKEHIAKKQSNVMDVLAKGGHKTLWIENDEGCKGVCDRTPTIIIDKNEKPYCDGSICRDDALLNDIDGYIKDMKDTGGVIVIHIMGSHGPTYYKRYPQDHRKFMPDCPRSDIQNCSAEEIVNTYDNTILFTDFIIAETIKKLKAQEGDINPSLLYVSDHGESLGENGIYLHGMPYGIAPDEQTKVPLIFWTTNTVAKAKGINLGCLRQQALTGTFSHDNIAHSLLGYMGVTTSLYKPDLDIFSTCKL